MVTQTKVRMGVVCSFSAAVVVVLVGVAFLLDFTNQLKAGWTSMWCLLMILALPAISSQAFPTQKSVARIITFVGWVGFVLLSLQLLVAPNGWQFDPHLILSIVPIGIYLCFVNGSALWTGHWPRPHAVLGILCGLIFFTVSWLDPSPSRLMPILVGCFALMPLWLFGMAAYLGPRPESGKSFLRVWFARGLSALAALIVLLLVAAWALGIREAGKRDAFLAQMKAQGIVLDAADMRSARPEGTKYFDGDVKDSALGFLLSAEAAGPRSNVDPMKWPWYQVATKQDRVFELPLEDLAKVRTVVEEQRDLIAKLKTVAQLPPTRIQDIVQFTGHDKDAVSVRTPNFLACKAFANLLLLDAGIAYLDGKPDEAMQTATRALQIGLHLSDQPVLISTMFSTAIWGIVSDFLAKIALNGEFSEAAMTELGGVLDQTLASQALARALTGEIVFIRQVFRSVDVRGDASLQTLVATDAPAQRALLGLYTIPLFRALFARDEVACVSLMSEQAKCAELPFYEAESKLQDLEKHPPSFTTPIAAIAMPNLLRVSLSWGEYRCRLIDLKMAMAAMRYKKATGSLPTTLEALAPAYLPEIPVNPITGKKRGIERVTADAAKAAKIAEGNASAAKPLAFPIGLRDYTECLLIR